MEKSDLTADRSIHETLTDNIVYIRWPQETRTKQTRPQMSAIRTLKVIGSAISPVKKCPMGIKFTASMKKLNSIMRSS